MSVIEKQEKYVPVLNKQVAEEYETDPRQYEFEDAALDEHRKGLFRVGSPQLMSEWRKAWKGILTDEEYRQAVQTLKEMGKA